jgi:hypothetical protein
VGSEARKVGADTAKPAGNRGKGRPKGAPNKVTADLRAMVLGALDDAGGQKYLATQAATNPSAFLSLVGRCLPKEITGPGGKDLFPTKIKIELVEP